MPWCPKCGREYREGFSFCVDCQCSLTDDPPEKVQTLPPAGDRMEPVLLCEIEDGPKTGLLPALLEGEGIPVLVRYPSIGLQTKLGCGFSLTGVRLYVDAGDLEAARELTAAFSESKEEAPGFSGPFPADRRRRKILLLCMLLPTLLTGAGCLLAWLWKLAFAR